MLGLLLPDVLLLLVGNCIEAAFGRTPKPKALDSLIKNIFIVLCYFCGGGDVVAVACVCGSMQWQRRSGNEKTFYLFCFTICVCMSFASSLLFQRTFFQPTFGIFFSTLCHCLMSSTNAFCCFHASHFCSYIITISRRDACEMLESNHNRYSCYVLYVCECENV